MKYPEQLTMICGGIGSGKSVVSRILLCKGYMVYDCDARAKQIMNNSYEIHQRLCEDIHADAVKDGIINRQLISEIVFKDAEALNRLNHIVHEAVKADLHEWCIINKEQKHLFAECAIPVSAGLAGEINSIWEVKAPLKERIQRVMARNNLSEEAVVDRINAQKKEDLSSFQPQIINNGFTDALLLQVNALLKKSDKSASQG